VVLLVEDNAINQKVGRRLIEKLGYQVDVASDGNQAVRMAEARRYDLIFMDCQMPDKDGFEATAEVRLREQGRRRTPIVAMTAYARNEDRERCLAAGMDGFLSKPVEMDSLRRILEDWVQAGVGGAG
jgi:CheY-like chemotaxis protein